MAFKVVFGITPKQARQLLNFSKNDSQIIRHTSDKKRFKNIKSFEKWSSKDRTIYTLVDKNGDLSGLIWFGKKSIPAKKFTKDVESKDYGFTFAIRTYGMARGKGYAVGFMKKAYKLFTSSTPYKMAKDKGVWLVTSYDNIPAIKIYKKFGFVDATRPDKKAKLIMILPSLKKAT